MDIEFEAKFLNINTEELRKKLKDTGAMLVHEERLMRRNIFDYPDKRLEKMGGWIRVRDEGDTVTFAYKQLIDRTIEGTKEISLSVEDFDAISNLLCAIGLEKRSYQETKRERWDFDGAEVTIDTWPWIPTFVELEGTSEEAVRDAAMRLDFDWNRALHGSVENAYQTYFNVSESEIDSWEEITFVPVPKWLESRKNSLDWRRGI